MLGPLSRSRPAPRAAPPAGEPRGVVRAAVMDGKTISHKVRP